jgi:hypothetical protein
LGKPAWPRRGHLVQDSWRNQVAEGRDHEQRAGDQQDEVERIGEDLALARCAGLIVGSR